MTFDLRVWNMHGPTVFGTTDPDKADEVLRDFVRLADGTSGPYRLVLTIAGKTFDMIERES